MARTAPRSRGTSPAGRYDGGYKHKHGVAGAADLEWGVVKSLRARPRQREVGSLSRDLEEFKALMTAAEMGEGAPKGSEMERDLERGWGTLESQLQECYKIAGDLATCEFKETKMEPLEFEDDDDEDLKIEKAKQWRAKYLKEKTNECKETLRVAYFGCCHCTGGKRRTTGT